MFQVKLVNGQVVWAKWVDKDELLAHTEIGEIKVKMVEYSPYWPGYSYVQI